jgi:transcriptional regulator with XRE-family HTH domain
LSTPIGAGAPDRTPSANLGTRLRQARLRAGITVRELARQLGVSASFISQLENGKSQPSVSTLYALAQCLGESIDRLFLEQNQSAASAPVATVAEKHHDVASDQRTTPENALPAEPVSRGRSGSH